MSRSEAISSGVQVTAYSFYVPERSAPERDYYYFGYRITITNLGDEPAKLLTRHWIITDSHERVQEVSGPGVVGETPRLDPGAAFEYSSACPLRTPSGAMRGSYTMTRDDGERFEAEIGPFTLEMPHSLN